MQHILAKVIPEHGLYRARKKRALIGISVKRRVEETFLNFPAVFAWTGQQFGSADVLVGDYLNRHNYQAFDGATQAEASARAISDGDQAIKWFSQLASLNVAQPSIVILAKSLFGDVTFRPRLARFETEYARNVKFRALIDEAVDKFLIRKRAGALHNNEVRDHCVSYQLEELALFELLVERGYGVLIYAGAQLPIMKAIVSRSLDGVPTSLADLTLVELRSFRPR